MFRLLADENFNGDIVRGILFRQPDLDLIRVQDVELVHVHDREILAWAAANNRILLTHDRATMPSFAYERVSANEPMAGVFVLNDRFPVGLAVREILLVIECSVQEEWRSRVVYLPI